MGSPLPQINDWQAERLPSAWLAAYYGTVLLMPLGMLVAAGTWGAVVVTLLALAISGAILGRLAGRAPMPVSSAASQLAPQR